MSSRPFDQPRNVRDHLHFDLPYNWVIGFPTVSCLFANIFFWVAAFGCSSFVARGTLDGTSSLHYGYWGIREQGKCQSFQFVDAPLKLGRALGIVGLLVGLTYLCFWISLWTRRVPRHVLNVVTASMTTAMMIMAVTLHFMGRTTESCDSWNCGVTGSGKLGLASAFFWLLTGVFVYFLADPEVPTTASPESAAYQNERARLVQPGTRATPAPNRATPVRPAPSSARPLPPLVHARPAPPRPLTVSVPQRPNNTPPSSAMAPTAPPAPRVVEEVNYQPDGTKAVTTTKSYVQPDGTTVVERTTEFSDRPSSEHEDVDEDAPLDAFKPNPQAQPPQPEFDEEHGRG